jgi:DNA-binding SARP family transcriptional activator/DNA-binding beta-propeller fold protein YncE
LLGPLEVVVDGMPLRLGGAKQRGVLALLVIHANAVVPAERLIDELWDATPPSSAANMLQGYVSQLRKLLGAETIVSTPPGYTLRADDHEIDARRFATLAAEAHRLLEDGEPGPSAARAREALDLRRGPPLADLAYEPFAAAEIERLQELCFAVLEDRIDADLALGRAAELVPELRELVAEQPLRERLRGQLMTALYRTGRQADALAVYRDTRRTLDERLGIEPGPELKELERAILRQDPALGVRRRLSRPRPRSVAVLVAAGLIGAASLGLVAATGGSKPTAAVAVLPHSVAVIDPANNSVLADIPVGGYPGPIAADGKYVYVCNIGDGTLSRIVPRELRQLDSSSFSRAIDLVAREGDLWAADGGAPGHTPLGVGPGTLLHYSPGPEWQTIRVGPDMIGDEQQTTLAADGRGATIWAGNADAQTVTELDGLLGRKLLTLRGISPGGLAVVSRDGADTVWATDSRRHAVVRISEPLRRVVARIPVVGTPTRVAADRHGVWVVTGHSLRRIDPATNRVVARIPLPIAAKRVALGAGSVWVTGYRSTRGGAVLRIDPRENAVVATIPLGNVATDGILVSHGLVWVAAPPSA